ncbi:MAG: excinuclease ABC subunit UvrC [Candidatus ainarchaeum sp.]|nr:excinuclease ABC subunit UvrC [Candidatus ainarchaeum sp.]MDD3975575.1 excinuclease ABC subunit UvrC [Candidatus ainarchaeum sp.]
MNNDIDLKNISQKPGCYIFKNKDNKIIYIGKAKNLKKRISSYFSKSKKNIKTSLLVENIYFLDYIVTKTEIESLILENNLINKYKPKFNIELKDNKKYAYILLTDEKIPRLLVSRDKSKKGTYFGPFVSANSRDYIIKTLNNIFKLRTCNKLSKNPCFRFYMGLCNGVCFGKENISEYNKRIKEVKQIFLGNTSSLLKDLNNQMFYFSKINNFESALVLKNKIESIKYLENKQIIERNKKLNEDIFNYYIDKDKVYIYLFNVFEGNLINKKEFILNLDRFVNFSNFIFNFYLENPLPKEIILPENIFNEIIFKLEKIYSKKIKIIVPKKGDKKKLLDLVYENILENIINTDFILKDLKKTLNLKNIPYHIECIDISHLSGTNIVSGISCYKNAKPYKKGYRKYKLKTVKDNNDFASIYEVTYRKFKKLLEEQKNFPDLFIIDGGKGQLSSAKKALDNLNIKNIDLISIAKKEEIIFKPNNLIGIKLSRKDKSLQLIQEIRDEAHRFSITYQKLLRKNIFK